MTTSTPLDLARDAFARRAWADTVERFADVDSADPLGVPDLERLAIATHMLGRPDDAIRMWERAHHAALAADDPARAARHAFHIIMAFGQRGDFAQAGGWMSRAMGLVDRAGDCVERGLLLIPMALRALDSGDPDAALRTFEHASEIGEQFGDPDLSTLGRLGRGQSLIAMGEVERGVALLDEAMVAVTTDDISPISVGIVYCASIESFQLLFDLGRAQEWTTALTRWCDSQPDSVPFRGRCLVYRAEILRFHGLWQEAVAEVERAHDWLSRPPPEPALGEADYQRAELHRLRGEFAEAEAAYRAGAKWGRRPDPGLALLRLAQGNVAAAHAMIRRAVDEADRLTRPGLLEPLVEVALAAGDTATARITADEIHALAAGPGQPPLLRAIAARADGTVKLATGDGMGALTALRRSWELWRTLDAPYETARTRVSVGLACRAVGDVDTAALELAGAREVLAALGAGPDVARIDAIGGVTQPAPGGLSPREVEVLWQVARGRTNRQIATDLGISERTVDRHVSNLYMKIDVTTRAAATAFAYEHGMVER